MAEFIELKELNEVFQSVFNDKSLSIEFSWNADNIDSWDSVTHMRLIASVEERFEVNFSYREVMKLNTVGDLLGLVNEKKSRS